MKWRDLIIFFGVNNVFAISLLDRRSLELPAGPNHVERNEIFLGGDYGNLEGFLAVTFSVISEGNCTYIILRFLYEDNLWLFLMSLSIEWRTFGGNG